MNKLSNKKSRPFYLVLGIAMAILPLIVLWGAVSTAFGDGTPLTGAGYLDFSYADTDFNISDPTGEKPESKLWWNDGYWWGSMYNSTTNAYHIYKLQWGTQTWADTGVKIDDIRDPLDPETTKADALWDAATNKLYVASHVFTKNAAPVSQKNYARLFRYTYDAVNQTYLLDTGFPVAVNKDKTETLVMDKDSTGRLWVTYVSRPTGNSNQYQVYVNTSSGGGLNNDASWGTPFVLPAPAVPITASRVTSDDISTLIAYNNQVAVVWSNQVSGTLNLALHPDGSNPQADWQHIEAPLPPGVIMDDHLSTKSVVANADGQLFVAVKFKGTNPTDPEVGVIARDTDGSISFHKYSERQHNDTRPILVLDETAKKLYVFVAGKEGGSQICYKTLNIKPPGQLDTMGNFQNGDCGIKFIEDDIYKDMNNPTSMKRNASSLTGIVVLASDDKNGKYYAHNVLGDPPPVVDATSPARGVLTAPLTSTISVSFSKDMNGTTITPSSFVVKSPGGPVAGSLFYDAGSKTAFFTPDLPLTGNTLYTIELTQAIQDVGGKRLNEGINVGNIRDTWTFTTASPTVQFDSVGYAVNEGQVATITAFLNAPSALAVQVDYTTQDGTAVAGVDYTAASGTLTFNPGIVTQTFTVATIDNITADGPKDLGLVLSNPVNADPGTPMTATLTIYDDESPPTVRFDTTNFVVNEGDGTATIDISLFPPSIGTVTVDFDTSDGTAIAGVDYTAVSETVTFNPGETTKTVDVPILEDGRNELDKTVNLTLSNATPGDVLIENGTATLTIKDNDPQPTVKFEFANYTVDEGAGKVTLNIVLGAESGRQVTVKYATGGGTATPGVDYQPASGTMTFAPGQTSQSLQITILDDNLQDSGETFNVALSDPNGATLGTPSTATVSITGQDRYTLYLPFVLRN